MRDVGASAATSIRPAIELVFVYGACSAPGLGHRRSLDRDDRAAGRSPPVHGRLLAPEARDRRGACPEARRQGRARPRRAHGPRRARRDTGADRRDARGGRGHRSALAEEVRPANTPCAAIRAGFEEPRCACHSSLPTARIDDLRGQQGRPTVPVPSMPHRRGLGPAPPRKAHPRRGGGRVLSPMWLRSLCSSPTVPSPRPAAEALQRVAPGRGPVVGDGSSGGPQMRSALRHLPRRTRGRGRYPPGRSPVAPRWLTGQRSRG